MGCLNADQGFDHWFGNIHLSGPCNRSCIFCIGQHMMALDKLINLKTWPLLNIDKFVDECKQKSIYEINVTGSNTDPLLYHFTPELKAYLLDYFPNLLFGLRTNGVLIEQRRDIWDLYDKASITVCSFDPEVYLQMMGKGSPPDIEKILSFSEDKDVKINTVLGPANVNNDDIFRTLDMCNKLGIKRINLREPYGQNHVGNPFTCKGIEPDSYVFGQATYHWGNVRATYWNVHYCEVESVNLYANGEVSVLYPVSKGHCKKTGKVLGQEHWPQTGRITEQWQYSG